MWINELELELKAYSEFTVLWNKVTRHFALKIWWDEFECLATLKAWFLKMDNSTIYIQHRNSSWYVLKECFLRDNATFSLIWWVLCRIRSHGGKNIVLDAWVDGKRGQDWKQRGYGIIQKVNILSFQGPSALQLLAIQQGVFCTMWPYSSQIWDPCKALRSQAQAKQYRLKHVTPNDFG